MRRHTTPFAFCLILLFLVLSAADADAQRRRRNREQPTQPQTPTEQPTTTPQAATPQGPAKLVVEAPSFDFGKVDQGQLIEHTFVLRNAGGQPLVVEDIKPGCGCTVVSVPNGPIAPGAVYQLRVVFNTNGKLGPQMRTIHLQVAGREEPMLLVMKGRVYSPGLPKAKQDERWAENNQ